MSEHYVVDFGSHSVKLHHLGRNSSSQAVTFHWDPLNDPVARETISEILSRVLEAVPSGAQVDVIGTAAARRDPVIATRLAVACRHLGVRYQTITQEREAELILAAYGTSSGMDVVNVGGGSIQIVRRRAPIILLEFGIADLNRLFLLNGPPATRDLAGAAAFLAVRLPRQLQPFVYSGGEKAYLLRLGARLDDWGGCSVSEFCRVTDSLAGLDIDALERLSPFDPGWMRGAVASNLIVHTLLEQAGLNRFVPSDANIADGMLERLIMERQDGQDRIL